MDEGQAYFCEDCERLIPASDVKGKQAPECCGRPMIRVPMAQCTKPPASPEHARLMDEDGPCRTE